MDSKKRAQTLNEFALDRLGKPFNELSQKQKQEIIEIVDFYEEELGRKYME